MAAGHGPTGSIAITGGGVSPLRTPSSTSPTQILNEEAIMIKLLNESSSLRRCLIDQTPLKSIEEEMRRNPDITLVQIREIFYADATQIKQGHIQSKQPLE
ncbi:hypothetical protein GIB67_013765 [Kingdonia uniflora]|uniref:Uncharacterized protein n=1 Tax=Kingdonia uniflora TaxID=39325 RepID=A0A7J7MN68_9MAGN|nr:hypothetical protein GIB67_013765 [Kingdonia uniflora]